MLRFGVTRNLICVILTLVCCGFAIWRGGGPERAGATILLSGSIITVFALHSWGLRYRSVETSAMIVDLAVLGLMIWLAIRANRFWPIGMSGLQILGIAGHILSITQSDLSPRVYNLVTALGIYPMLLLLGIGTRNHRRRLRAIGADRSWAIYSRPLERSSRHNGQPS